MNERVIFDAALQIADPQARRAFVEKACAGNPEMLAAVESLLKSHDAAGSFLDIPAAEQIKAGAPGKPEDSAAAVEKTRSYQPGDADGDDETDATPPDLSFLQPSNKPGSIGVLGHYEVLQVLGQGGFGTVLKAFDEKLHRLVAIKVMNAQIAATSPPRKRFLREARAAAGIRHENIVQVHSVEELPLPYLVMEFIDGQTLRQKLDGAGPLEVPEVLHIGRQIASGLAAAQAMGLIHRDIKPGNILIEQGAEQRVKITDFGLARAADDASLTRSGTISGTPMYMAPEQALGRPLDHRADLFSLGSVLYELTCGRPPFRAPTTVAVLLRVAEDTPRPMQEIIPEIPDWLVAIVTKLHAKKPEDRFQTAKEVADLLARCQTELQLNGKVTCVPIAPSSPVAPRQESRTSLDTGHANGPQATSDVTRAPGLPVAERQGYQKAPKSNRRWLITATVLVVALVAAIVFRRGNDSTSEISNLKSQISNPPGQAESTDSTNPDVRAAEYVLSIGGVIFININGKEQRQGGGELPQGEFKLTATEMAWHKVTDAGLVNFKDCKNLTALYLAQLPVTDVGLSYFKDCKDLKYLTLDAIRTSDAGLVHFKDCKEWKRIHLNGMPITDAGVVHFQVDKNLTDLTLNTLHLSDAGLAHFKDCKSLTDLKLRGAPLSDAGLAHFKDCKNIVNLDLVTTQMTDVGLAYFKDCKNLKVLDLDRTNLSDAGLESLATFPHLNTLRITRTKVTEAGVKKLSAALPGCKIEWDGGVIEPTVSPDRRAAEYVLSIGGGVVIWENEAERSVLAVADLPQKAVVLTSVYLSGNSKVTDAGFVSFKGCKNLRYLALDNIQVSDAGLAHFKDCKNLTHLELSGTKVSDAGLAQFKDCKNLMYLGLGGTSVSDVGLIHFKDCKNLTHLGLGNTQVSDAGLVHFKDCKNLTHLGLYVTQVSDAGLAHFQDCKNLTYLTLEHTQVSDAGLVQIFKDHKNLTQLGLGYTRVSDARLPDLASLPNLERLNLDNTRISFRGYEQLKAALPKCQITWFEPNRSVAERVLALGGSVEIGSLDKPESRSVQVAADLPGDYFQVRRVSLAGVTQPLDPLRPLLALLTFPQFDRLESIDLSGSTGLDYSFLVPIHGLRELTLANAGLNDASLANLPKLNTLQRLVLDGNDIRGTGLTHLSKQPKLIDLSLSHPNLTNLSAENLTELKPLKRLSLAGSGMTNAGIKQLSTLTNLESLDLRRTKVTAAGIDDLKAVLPECKIQWDGMPNL